jgi:hypothetical protein
LAQNSSYVETSLGHASCFTLTTPAIVKFQLPPEGKELGEVVTSALMPTPSTLHVFTTVVVFESLVVLCALSSAASKKAGDTARTRHKSLAAISDDVAVARLQ